MDLQALSHANEVMTNHLESMKSYQEKMKSKVNNNLNKKNSNDIILAKKGDSCYVQNFDTNNDGEITMDEFNAYCEENGISAKDKVKILSTMNAAKSSSKVLNKTIKKDKEEKDTEKEVEREGAVYARKGDDKYNEVMDTDKNNVVTYKEYLEYCNKREKDDTKDNKDSSNKDKVSQLYLQNEKQDDEPEISVEATA